MTVETLYTQVMDQFRGLSDAIATVELRASGKFVQAWFEGSRYCLDFLSPLKTWACSRTCTS